MELLRFQEKTQQAIQQALKKKRIALMNIIKKENERMAALTREEEQVVDIEDGEEGESSDDNSDSSEDSGEEKDTEGLHIRKPARMNLYDLDVEKIQYISSKGRGRVHIAKEAPQSSEELYVSDSQSSSTHISMVISLDTMLIDKFAPRARLSITKYDPDGIIMKLVVVVSFLILTSIPIIS